MINYLVGGWLTPLKNDGVKVSWDDDILKIWKVIKAMFQTTNQIQLRPFTSYTVSQWNDPITMECITPYTPFIIGKGL